LNGPSGSRLPPGRRRWTSSFRRTPESSTTRQPD
jgi:hypothetical protein